MLLLSIIPAGFRVQVSGRTPTIQPFDLVLIAALLYLGARTFFGDFFFSFGDKKILSFFGAFMFASVLSMTLTMHDPLRSLVTIKTFLFGYLTLVIVLSCASGAVDGVATVMLMAGAAVSILLGIDFSANWQEYVAASAAETVQLKSQLQTTVGHSNYIAALLIIIIPIGLGLAFSRRGWRHWVLLSLSGLNVIGLVITLSRGAVFSLILATLLATPYLRRAGVAVKHYVVALVTFTIGLLLLPSSFVSTLWELVLERLQTFGNRVDLFSVAWHTFLRNPIFGVGPGCMYIYIQQFAVDNSERHCHNLILNSLAEVGLFGTIPFLLMVGVIMWRSWRVTREALPLAEMKHVALGLYVTIIATLLHSMLEPTFQGGQYSALFFSAAAMVLLLEEQIERTKAFTSEMRS